MAFEKSNPIISSSRTTRSALKRKTIKSSQPKSEDENLFSPQTTKRFKCLLKHQRIVSKSVVSSSVTTLKNTENEDELLFSIEIDQSTSPTREAPSNVIQESAPSPFIPKFTDQEPDDAISKYHDYMDENDENAPLEHAPDSSQLVRSATQRQVLGEMDLCCFDEYKGLFGSFFTVWDKVDETQDGQSKSPLVSAKNPSLINSHRTQRWSLSSLNRKLNSATARRIPL